jgi:hypothetical protein
MRSEAKRSPALLLPRHHRASVVGAVTAPLSFLLSISILDMEHDATDRFMRNTICCCYGAERFPQLHHTMYDCRPKFSGNTIVRIFRSCSSMLEKRRVGSLK